MNDNTNTIVWLLVAFMVGGFVLSRLLRPWFRVIATVWTIAALVLLAWVVWGS